MKRRLFALVLLLPLVFSACGDGVVKKEASTAATTTPIGVEYGKSDTFVQLEKPLVAYVTYPVIGYAAVDTQIKGWVQAQYEDASKAIDLQNAGNPAPPVKGEMNVQYNDYLLLKRYVGIELIGRITSNYVEHAKHFIKTYNVDLANGLVLKNSDILDMNRPDALLKMLKEKILAEFPAEAPAVEKMDARWLERLVLNHTGVDVLLPRGAFIAQDLGDQRFTLPYAELDSLLLLPELLAPQSETTLPRETAAPSISAPTAPTPAGGVIRKDLDPSKPMLALTFDDGPSGSITPKILDLLKANGARATFCVVGNRVAEHAAITRRMVAEGNEITGHSWDHTSLPKLKDERIAKQLKDTNDAIYAATGVIPAFYRPPYGAVNKAVKEVSAEQNLALLLWSVDTEDWKSRNADKVEKATMDGAKDGAIILYHDLYESTYQAVSRAIPKLVAQGYQLVTVSELFYYSGQAIEVGKSYHGNY
ncbi:MAG: polysaccharide deacetylase family protein [Oscillospiraceae bacterium]|jgi:peptidoglycan/xylan/chitin deacetylase (PgdA/CDA1 family)|nr:polysaccharide deacetylase family protein [Oscillospiraceae bacterium]